MGDNRLKWCAVGALCRAFLPQSETLTETRFYTARPDHFPADVRKRYLLSEGISLSRSAN